MPVDFNYLSLAMPEFANADPAFVAFYIAEAKKYINFELWGDKSDYAWALFAAHMMTLAKAASASSGGGPATSSRVGDLARTYGGPMSNNVLEQTSYGKLFLQLRKTIFKTPLVVTDALWVV